MIVVIMGMFNTAQAGLLEQAVSQSRAQDVQPIYLGQPQQQQSLFNQQQMNDNLEQQNKLLQQQQNQLHLIMPSAPVKLGE